MKLKLEVQGDVTILSVSEEILPPHPSVLRAGIMKLFTSGKKKLLLDLTAITQVDEAPLREIVALQNLTVEHDAQMAIASTLPGIGHAPSREEALKLMASQLFLLLATEKRLQIELQNLEKQRNDINTKLSGLKSGDTDAKSLKAENSAMKMLAKQFEKQIRVLLNARQDPKPVPAPIAAKMGAVQNILTGILEQEGVLPVK